MNEGILRVAGLGTFATNANGGATDSLPGLFALTTKHGWILGDARGGVGCGLGEEGTGRGREGADGLGAEGGCNALAGGCPGGRSDGETADHHDLLVVLAISGDALCQ